MTTYLPAHQPKQPLRDDAQQAALREALLELLNRNQPVADALPAQLTPEMIVQAYGAELQDLIARSADEQITISCSLRVTYSEED